MLRRKRRAEKARMPCKSLRQTSVRRGVVAGAVVSDAVGHGLDKHRSRGEKRREGWRWHRLGTRRALLRSYRLFFTQDSRAAMVALYTAKMSLPSTRMASMP